MPTNVKTIQDLTDSQLRATARFWRRLQEIHTQQAMTGNADWMLVAAKCRKNARAMEDELRQRQEGAQS